MHLLTAAAIALLLGSIAWFSWHERQQLIDGAADLGVRRADRLAGELGEALALADAAIRQLEARLERLPPGAAGPAALGETMAAQAPLLAGVPLPFEIHALDAAGRVVEWMPGREQGGGPAPDRPGAAQVLTLPTSADGWRVGLATGPVTERRLPLVRRAAANAHGVAAFAVGLQHARLLQRFEQWRVPKGGGVALFRIEADGATTVLARVPHDDALLGRTVRGPLAAALARQPGGVFHDLTQLDRTHRLVAYRRLGGTADRLVVGYGMATDALLAEWQVRTQWMAGIALLLAAAMAAGGRWLGRSLLAIDRQQQSLARSESHYRALAGNLPDVVARMDRQGRHLYVNAAVTAATGLRPEDLVGKTYAEVGMPAHQLAQWMPALERVFASGRNERLEFDFTGPEGLRQWEALMAREPVVPGMPQTALVISRDITERTAAEAVREQLHRRMLDLLENMSDGFVSLDRQWRYQYVNRKAGELLGRTPESLQGKHIWTEFPEGVGQPFQRAYERAMNEGVAMRMEEHYPPWDAWFENRIHPTADGISVFFTDVTQRRRAADALAASEARYRQLFEHSPLPLLVYERRSLRLLAVNEAFCSRYGYERGQALDLKLPELYPEEQREAIVALAGRIAGLSYAGEWTHLRRDGSAFPIEARSHDIELDGRTARIAVIIDLSERRRAEAERRAAAERFERLFLAAPEAISISELGSGRFVQVNDAFCALFGHEREALIGHTSLELGLWTRPQGRAGIVARLRSGKAVRGFEGQARHRSGALLDVLFSAEKLVFDGADCLLLMFRDVTERRRLEAVVQASEARLAHLLRHAPTVIYTARAGGDYAATYYSPNIAELVGWTAEQFVREPAFWLDHVHADDRAGVLARLQALHEHDEVVLEYRFRHADGSWRWMRDAARVQRGPGGEATELVGSWIDITGRREAEEEARRLATELEHRVQERTAQLALSEQRYRTIFEAVPISIGEEDWSGVLPRLRGLRAAGVVDGAGHFAAHPEFVSECLRAVRVVRLNRQALALHDARDRERDLPDLQAFFPRDEDLVQFAGELEAVWAGERLFTAKRSLPSLAGRTLNLMVTISLPALDGDDGDDVTALVCLVDITEIDRLNAELDRSLARLREANKELETFTYSVSHDLKAPLRGIDGYSRLLLSEHGQSLDDEGRLFLGHIRKATQHMGVLIDDLLAYSRLERRTLTLAPLALGEVVEQVLAACRSDLDASGAEVQVQVDAALRAHGDLQGLTMALRNLVDNAIKFTRASRPARIDIGAEAADGRVRLSVRDNGVGFDMKFHDRIFAIFQRLNRAEEYPGTGVGLAIVRKAMDRMGGRAWAESLPGQGATFFLELPEALP